MPTRLSTPMLIKYQEENILSRLLHVPTPYLGVINSYVQSDLATLSFKNVEQLEDVHSIILRLKQ